MDNSLFTKKRITSLFLVIASNFVTLAVGILSGFIIPKIMSISDYGLYKIYALYINYLPLFSLGFSAGIYLKYGGKNYDELNYHHFRFFTRFFLLTQLFFSLSVFVFAFLPPFYEYKLIILALSFMLLVGNLTQYFQLISQFTERYKEYSFRNFLNSLLLACAILVFFVLYINNIYVLNYKIYLAVLMSISLVLSLWYIFTYRAIVFGRIEEKPTKRDVFDIYKVGFFLSISGLIAQLMLNLDRQFVSVLFSIEDYAIYAFAYSLLSFISTFISSISTIIYPSLKRLKREQIESTYSFSIGIINIVSSILFGLFFVAKLVVNAYLTKYNDSIFYFWLIIPSVAFSSSINVVIHNYFKTIDKEMNFFFTSIIAFSIAFIANLIAFYCFKTMEAISIASIISMFIWYVLSQIVLSHSFKFKFIKNSLFILFVVAAFYLFGYISNTYVFVSILGYCLLTILLIIFFYIKEIQTILNNLKHKKTESQSF